MRSELVFSAVAQVSNRFLLARALAKATRSLHKPGSRIEETTNEALDRFSRANPFADENAVRVSSTVALHRNGTLPVILRNTKSIVLPPMHESPRTSSEALPAPGD